MDLVRPERTENDVALHTHRGRMCRNGPSRATPTVARFCPMGAHLVSRFAMRRAHMVRWLALVLAFATHEDAHAASERARRPEGAHAMRGKASWYGRAHHGRRTASGRPFNMFALTAAHRTLPFGTRVRVVHERTGRSVDVTIDDRGPYVRGRIIDLSRRSAEVLGMVRAGLGDVRLERLPLRSWLPPDGAESPPQFSGKSLQQAAWFSARASLVDPLAVEAQLFR